MYKSLLLLVAAGLLAAEPALAQFSVGVGGGHRGRGGGMVIQPQQSPSKPDYEKLCEQSSGPAAVQNCTAAVNDDNKNEKAWRLLGDAYLSVRQPREALQAYETALRLKPGMPAAMRGRDAAYAALAQRPPAGPAPAPYATAQPQPQYQLQPQPAGAGPRDGEWSGKLQRQCSGGSDEGAASVIVTGENFAGVFFSGGGGRDLNGRIAADGSVEAAGRDATGAAFQARGRLMSASTLTAEGQAGPCKMILTLARVGAPASAAAPAPAAMPAAATGSPLDGEWAGAITPRGKHFAVSGKVVNGKLVIDQQRGGERIKAEGAIGANGLVALSGKAGDDTMRGQAPLEIKGQFTGSTFEGQGRWGDLATTMRMTRVGGPPPAGVQSVAAPPAAYAPAPAPAATQQAAASPPAPTKAPAKSPAGANVIQAAPQPTVDKKPPVIAVPSKVETLGPVVELNGKVSDGSSIIEFTVNGQAVPVAQDGTFTVRRGVPVGVSELKLSAVDEWGNAALKTVAVTRKPGAEPAQVAAAGDGRKTAAAAPAIGAADLRNIDFGRFHAVVIGNNKYQKVRTLDTAVNDARVVAEVLRNTYKFEVDLVIDGTRQQMLEALYKMRARLSEKDNLLVYYAGHGVVDKETGRGYWLPVDADPDLPTNWVPTTDLTDVIKAIQARHIMVVADSCYSGTLLRNSDANIRTARSDEMAQWVERILSKRSRTVLSSGGVEPVMDGGGGGHSVFAKAFLDALRDNQDVLDGQGLFAAIRRPIALNAAGQIPEYADIRQAGHDGGDFLFVRR